MKIRFYCDIPKNAIHYPDYSQYWASTKMFSACAGGYVRHCFDVDLPVTDVQAAKEIPGLQRATVNGGVDGH